MDDPEEVIELDPGDVLDLHTFAPRDAVAVTEAWLEECVRRGYGEVRLIHGKGIGALKKQVRALLDRHPDVASYRSGDEGRGGWGATLIALRRPG